MDENDEDKKEVEEDREGKVEEDDDDKEREEREEEEEEEEFDDPRMTIYETLSKLDAPGTYACGARFSNTAQRGGGGASTNMDLRVPGLVVDGVGPIALPLHDSQVGALAARCSQAPFGKGERTVVDTTVRKTWQLDPADFSFTNPTWTSQVARLARKVCGDLGVHESVTVEAQLYKLLLYETGGFFKPHRDSEKAPGMFGTLVVVLPSAYTGGELVVEHGKHKQTFDHATGAQPEAAFTFSYMSFYADCKHEILPITSGSRLCVVYNLVKTGGAGPAPSLCGLASHLETLVAAAKQWAASFNANRNEKLVLMTEHLYTPAARKSKKSKGGKANLTTFKGGDQAVMTLLESAIEAGADLDFDTGSIDFSESGCGSGEYGWGGFEWDETLGSTITLSTDEYGELKISQEEEVLPEGYFDDLEPADETFEPTGNEGVQAERTYDTQSCIVIWPRSARWIVTTDGNVDAMADYLLDATKKKSNS